MEGAKESPGLQSDLAPDSRRLIVTFGGLMGAVAAVGPAGDRPGRAATFEFARSLRSVPLKTVFVRDHAFAWYHRGVEGVGADIDSVAEHLRALTGDAEEVVMVGNSAGGYAALLFGALLGCEVHAFSPQTFIDPALRATHGDSRWASHVEALGGDLESRYADLLPVLARSNGRFHVYYATDQRLDAIHAERLGGLPQATLHGFEYPGHGLIRALRECGWLASFVDALVAGAAVPALPRRIPMPPRPPSDPEGPGIVSDLSADSDRLIVTFGGLGGGLGPMPTELGRFQVTAPRKTIFVRDHASAWYHRGVAGVGSDIDSVVGHLRAITGDAEQVVMVGNSAGGYAALLFGALLGCEVHAFSPQTFIDPALRAAHGDTRWVANAEALDGDLDPRYVDLMPLIARSSGRFHVYYAATEAIDVVHAARLGTLPNVTLHALDEPRANVLKELRKTDWMGSFVRGLVTGAGIPPLRS